MADEFTQREGIVTDFWRPGGSKPCWVCGEPTEYAFLDMSYQHPDCDGYPSDVGDVRIVNGRIVEVDE